MKRLALLAALALVACGVETPPPATPSVVYRDPLAGRALPVAPAPLGPRPETAPAQIDALFVQVCRLTAFVVEAVPLLAEAAGKAGAQAPAYPECEDPPR